MIKRAVLAFLLLLLAFSGFLLTGWGKSIFLPKQTLKVVLDGESPYWIPLFLANGLGYFKQEGLNISLSVAPSREALLDTLAKEPVVALTEPDALLFSSECHPLMFLCMARLEGSYLLCRQENAKPFNWSDLKGQTVIGYSPGSLDQAALEAVLKKKGLPAQYQLNVIENIPAPLRIPSFLAGVGQYLQVDDTEATLLEEGKLARVVASIGVIAGDLPAGVAVAPQTLIKNNPKVLLSFARAIYRAQLWLSSHPSSEISEKTAGFFPQLSQSTLSDIVEEFKKQNVWAASPQINSNGYNNWEKMLMEAGELAHPLPFDTAVTNIFAARAMQKNIWRWPEIFHL